MSATWKVKRSERSSTAAATWLLKSERTREAVTWPITTAKQREDHERQRGRDDGQPPADRDLGEA